jgi:hypothetical protein
VPPAAGSSSVSPSVLWQAPCSTPPPFRWRWRRTATTARRP